MTEPNPIPFWFLRHGETDWNARMLSQGQVDIPLNPVGIAQAERAAAALVGKGIRSIHASTLSRARVTAEIVAARLQLPVNLDADLQECAFGVQEGQQMSGWFDDWIAGITTPEGAEPFAHLRERAVAAINRAIAHPGPVLVVAHGALWRAFRQAAGLEANVRTPNALPLWVEPPSGGRGWHFTPAELAD
ncbi:histidine phosphatase family protein [Roseomonas xinghualingensis]|uniref:histidine phosphatase family protein n=1 Tax=Roseomonas xinghualingensis TaxID=2986475 RepID=UPI0021F1B263|nr:histidine phosphatase family protein [Roseomonas sp. SXEYE001]MCV4206386.1 histidine phosphatase family protein [Roseomonas sp. SXEYE001]